ncbi:M24 family metallopeptidase [Roseiflexus sp.]|uniref:M24 family metallopeptidase n=1 Tax=Roseiflexus sp. TaxID=2562120 RepID=UPI00398B5393
MTVYADRLAVLIQTVADAGLQGLIINQTSYIFHLSGWMPPHGAPVFLVIGPRCVVLVTPFEPDAPGQIWNQSIWYDAWHTSALTPAVDRAIVALREAVSGAGLHRHAAVGAACDALPARVALSLLDIVHLRDAHDLLFRATMIKDAVAQQAIRERVAMLDHAFVAAARSIRPGVSELEVYGAIVADLTLALGAPPVVECVFGSGPRTLTNEPQPTSRILAPGDVVLIDLFPNLSGYVADYTRCFVVGAATDAQLAQHLALQQALEAAERALRPGIAAVEIDRLVRQSIETAGYGPWCYQHHTGHGFGVLAVEPPWILPSSTTLLEEGMVIAIEPGIYHPGYGGMRLEGNYIITGDGCESLAGYPAVLTECR